MNIFLVIPLGVLGVAALISILYAKRSISPVRMTWMLSIFPALAFGILLWLSSSLYPDRTLSLQIEWIPSLGLILSLYLDQLSSLFALLITGIGTLIVVYLGYYFEKETGVWRFLTYLFIFMTAMLGLVLAGDVITLFIFWEATSISSFLLVAYKNKDSIAGGSDYTTILGSGAVLRSSPFYPAFLGLVALGRSPKAPSSPHIFGCRVQ
ncbi:MAG: hypothetical protein ACWGO1_12490 [Anaerolineales bacterium]